MTEDITVALIGLIGVVLGGGVMWFIAVRKLPKELNVMEADEAAKLSQALNSATEALISRTNAANAERKNFEDRINELEAHRDMRSREIHTMQQTIETMSREYVKEIQGLKDTVAVLQTQVDEAEKRYASLKRQTLRLYQALKDANVPLEIDPELRDTLERMKAVGK